MFAINLLIPVSASPELDIHWLWDDRCASCHGHSAEFARKFLGVSDGKLQGRHHVGDLHLFLNNHYLAGQSVDDVYAMLLAQVTNQARFKKECSGCHQNAASFVRETLQREGAILKIRKSDESVEGFLKNHRGLSEEDIDFYTALLTRIAKEVDLP